MLPVDGLQFDNCRAKRLSTYFNAYTTCERGNTLLQSKVCCYCPVSKRQRAMLAT
jgi:hypothetical protein